jgi:hypothetical protein
MSEISYPQSFPFTNIQRVISLYRQGSIKDNVDQFAFDVWVIQGYGQKAILGSPQVAKIQSEDQAVTEELVVQYLEKSVSEEPSAQSMIPWSIIIPFLVRELLKYLENRSK